MGRSRFLGSGRLIAMALAAAVSLAGPAGAITIDINRVAADAIVPDLSSGLLNGVGRVGGCTGSAISSMHVLTAAHCFDPGISRATFRLPYSDVPPVAISGSVLTYPGYDRAEYSYRQKAVPDLAILSLDQALPDFVRNYRLVPAGMDPVGATFQLAGYGNTGTGSSGEMPGTSGDTLRFGLNEVDRLAHDGYVFTADFDGGLAFGTEVGTPTGPGSTHVADNNRSGSEGLGILESMTAKGDSGGPAFYNPSIALSVALVQNPLGFDVDPALVPDENFILGVSSYGTRYGDDPFSSFGSTATWTLASQFGGWIDSVVRGQSASEDFTVISDREMLMPADFLASVPGTGPAHVPIPGSVLTLATGLAALFTLRRRRTGGCPGIAAG